MPTITLKATDEFAAKLDQAAEAAGESRSEYLRAAAEARMNPPVIGQREPHGLAERVATIPRAEPRPPPRRPDTENGKATRSVRRQGAVAGKGKPPTKPPPPARGSVDLHRDEVTMFPKKPK